MKKWSSKARKFLLTQLREYHMKEAGERYRKCLVSLAEAATHAGVSLYEMMDFVDRERIVPPGPSRAELEKEAAFAAKIFAGVDFSKDSGEE